MSRKALVALVVGALTLGGAAAVLLYRGPIRVYFPSGPSGPPVAVTLPNSEERVPIEGVDVSHHQGKIDWTVLKGPSVRFAYIKASEGATFKDSAFSANWIGAQSAGVVPGAYHYFSLCRSGAEQAANFLAAVPNPSPATLPPAVDVEFRGNCARRPSPAEFRQELQTFLSTLEAAWGCRLVLYVTQEFYAAYLEGQFENNPLWVRDLSKRPALRSGREWRIWQFSDRGRLPGVSTYVDLNAFNGTPSEFAAFRCAAG